jgi:hypothetical protein
MSSPRLALLSSSLFALAASLPTPAFAGTAGEEMLEAPENPAPAVEAGGQKKKRQRQTSS